MNRTAELKRKTKETEINCKVNLDGKGAFKVNTGIGFLDHMIEQLSKHSEIDININPVVVFAYKMYPIPNKIL